MTVLESILLSLILIYLIVVWIKKDSRSYSSINLRLNVIKKRFENSCAMMENQFKEREKAIDEKIELFKKQIEKYHGVDMDKKSEEWRDAHMDEIEEMRKRRELDGIERGL